MRYSALLAVYSFSLHPSRFGTAAAGGGVDVAKCGPTGRLTPRLWRQKRYNVFDLWHMISNLVGADTSPVLAVDVTAWETVAVSRLMTLWFSDEAR